MKEEIETKHFEHTFAVLRTALQSHSSPKQVEVLCVSPQPLQGFSCDECSVSILRGETCVGFPPFSEAYSTVRTLTAVSVFSQRTKKCEQKAKQKKNPSSFSLSLPPPATMYVLFSVYSEEGTVFSGGIFKKGDQAQRCLRSYQSLFFLMGVLCIEVFFFVFFFAGENPDYVASPLPQKKKFLTSGVWYSGRQAVECT